MKENKVYILLTDTGSFLTKLIKLYTKKQYNHVSISFDFDLTEVYSFGRKKAGNPFDGGFVKEDVRKGLFKNADCAVYSITVTDRQMMEMKQYINELESKMELFRYHFLGLFGFLINKPIQRENAFFCSQFVASVLKNSNTVDFEKPPALIAPHDFEEVANLNLEFEGKLKNYRNDKTDNKWYAPARFIQAEV